MEGIEHTAAEPEESTENLDEYEYTTLQPNEIRLVTIHPGSGSDELKSTIITEDLDLEGVPHNCRYATLSDRYSLSAIPAL